MAEQSNEQPIVPAVQTASVQQAVKGKRGRKPAKTIQAQPAEARATPAQQAQAQQPAQTIVQSTA